MESTYAIASVSFLYILPLIIIVVCYIRIIQSVTSSALIEVSDTRDEIEDVDELGRRKKKESRRRWRFGGEREVSRNTRMKSPNRVSVKLALITNVSRRKLNDDDEEKRRKSTEGDEENSKGNCVEEQKCTEMVSVASRKEGEERNGREEIPQEELDERKEKESGRNERQESGREKMTCLKGNEEDSDGRKRCPVLSTSRTKDNDVVVIVNQRIEGKEKKKMKEEEEVKEKEGKGKKEDEEERLRSTDLIPNQKVTSSPPPLELRSSEAKTNCSNAVSSPSTFLSSSSDHQENHHPSRNILDRSSNVVGLRIPEYSVGNQYQNPNLGESTSAATTLLLNHHRLASFLPAQQFLDRIKGRIMSRIRKEQSLTEEEERKLAEDDERKLAEDEEGSKENGRRLNEKMQSNIGSNYMTSGLRTGYQSSCNSIKRRYSNQATQQSGYHKRTTARAAIMDRARKRTLKMTIAIVLTFILCWTPYAVMVIWYQIHMSSALSMTPSWLMSLLWVFAYTNSVLDPFVHSNHLFRIRSLSSLISGRNTGGNNMNGSLSNEITIESHL